MRSTAHGSSTRVGLNLVVISLRVTPPWGGCPIAIPVNARLHRKNDADHHHRPRRRDDPRDRRLAARPAASTCAADGAYATLAGADLPRTAHLTCRMRRDAALYQAAPPRTGRRGRPRTKGDRLPTPPGLAAAAHQTTGHAVQIDQRGKPITRQVLTSATCSGTGSTSSDLVRLVIVRDPDGIEPDDYFFTTDLTATGGQVATRYAGRWPIEVCFRDVKQDLGGQDPQSWKRQGPERAACLSLWLHATTWCWYLDTHPDRPHLDHRDPGTATRPPPASSTPSPRSAASCGHNELQPCHPPDPTTRKSPTPCSTRSPTPHSRQPRVRVDGFRADRRRSRWATTARPA